MVDSVKGLREINKFRQYRQFIIKGGIEVGGEKTEGIKINGAWFKSKLSVVQN